MAGNWGDPVADKIQVPDANQPLKMLSGFLGLKQQQQALQKGDIDVQKGQTELQDKQQSLKQRQGIANIDWSKYDDGTGTISTDKMLDDADLRAKSGDQFLEVMKHGAAIRTEQLQSKRALVGLNNDLLGQFGTMLGAAAKDPDIIADNQAGRDKAKQILDDFARIGGPDAARVAKIYAPKIDQLPKGGLVRGVVTLQGQAMSAAQQVAAQQPSYVNAGATQTQVNPLAAGGNLGDQGNIVNTVSPGVHLFTDQAGNTHGVNQQNLGNSVPVGQGQGLSAQQQQQQSPTTPANPKQIVPGLEEVEPPLKNPGQKPPMLGIGEADQVKANTQTVIANRKIAEDAQIQKDVLNHIKTIASDPNLFVGPGSQRVADIANAVSKIPGFEKAGQYTNNYNELTKFMAQNAARLGKQMGLEGSDFRLEQVLHATPNTQIDKKTIQDVADYMNGIVSMGLSKASAMDNWLEHQGNSLKNSHQFEKIWRENADPRLFQLSEMKDQKEAIEYAKKYIKPSERNDLQKKHDLLRSLGVFK